MNKQPQYSSIAPQEYFPVRLSPDGQIYQPREGTGEAPVRSVEELEKTIVRDTSYLINALDGSLDDDLMSKPFLDGHRRREGPCDAAIYLDKSARPVRALVNEFWDAFSNEKSAPSASFLNIDKIDYLYHMGYTDSEIKERYIPPEEIDIKNIPANLLKIRAAQIRSLYLEDSSKLPDVEQLILSVEHGSKPTELLDTIWELPTKLDSLHVAIVDEVKSSAATLTIADQLLKISFPDTDFEPLFWQTPATHQYMTTLSDGRTITQIADTEKPLWYDNRTSAGRGGIGNINPAKALLSKDARVRIGAHIIGRPYREENNHPDVLGVGFRKDFKELRRRFNEGYIPKPADARRQDT